MKDKNNPARSFTISIRQDLREKLKKTSLKHGVSESMIIDRSLRKMLSNFKENFWKE